jgi:hypothetical protein
VRNMESQSAKVIQWNAKPGKGRDDPASDAATGPVTLGPLEDVLIVLSDEQLDAMAATFRMNPARKAMTFEAYLTVRGFAREHD